MGLNAGVGLNKLVKAPQQRAAAGHHDAVGGDVGHQLGGSALQNAVDGLQNAAGDLLEGLDHLAGGDGEHTGQAGHQAAALDLHSDLLGAGEHAADGHLQLLSGAVADEDVVLAADILHHSLVELVAGDLDGSGLYHTAQGDDGDVGGTAADVYHHVAIGLGDVDAGADGGGHGLLNEVSPAGTSLDAGVHHGALLDLGDAGRHADEQAGLEEGEGGHLPNKLLQHPLGHVVVGDDALTQRTHGNDVAGGTAQHGLGVGAHLQQLAGILVHGHHGGLAQDHALALNINQDGGGTKVNSDVLAKQIKHSVPPYLIHSRTGCPRRL